MAHYFSLYKNMGAVKLSLKDKGLGVYHLSTLKMTLGTGHANIGNTAGHRLFELVKRFGNRLGHIRIETRDKIKKFV